MHLLLALVRAIAMQRPRFVNALVISLAVLRTGAAEPKPISVHTIEHAGPVDFEHEVLPILRSSCLACHNRTRAKAGLILESPGDILEGGDSGPAVVPGHAGDSLLLQLSAHQDKPHMPPADNKVSAADLTPEQLGLIGLWIDQGAKGEVHSAAAVQWHRPAAGVQPTYAVAISPDGTFLAAARANRIHLYHLPTRRLIATLTDPKLADADAPSHRDLVQSLAFSPDGHLLASGAYAEVKLWRLNPPTFARIRQPQTLEKNPLVARSGNQIAAAGADGTIRLWNVADGRLVRQFSQGAAVSAIAIAPDETWLATAGIGTPIKLWDIAAGTLIAEMYMNANALIDAAQAQRRQFIAAADVAYFKAQIERTTAAKNGTADRATAAASY